MSFKENATAIDRGAVAASFFGALIHIIAWVVPEIVSPAIQGTGLTRATLPTVMHITAVVIITAGIAEIWRLDHRPTAAEKIEMATGAFMSVTAGILHFATVVPISAELQVATYLTYAANIMAIVGALMAAWSIGQWNPER